MQEKLLGQYIFVSGNIVNHPLLSHLHAKLGALLPFEPPPPGLDPYIPFVLPEKKPFLDDSPAKESKCVDLTPLLAASIFENSLWEYSLIIDFALAV